MKTEAAFPLRSQQEATVMPAIQINRAPVLTLWAAVVAGGLTVRHAGRSSEK
jgi:hypothetical protein